MILFLSWWKRKLRPGKSSMEDLNVGKTILKGRQTEEETRKSEPQRRRQEMVDAMQEPNAGLWTNTA